MQDYVVKQLAEQPEAAEPADEGEGQAEAAPVEAPAAPVADVAMEDQPAPADEPVAAAEDEPAA